MGRCLLLDLPLLLLVSVWALVFVARCVWTDYYVPIMARARRTDVELLDEYTYYERTCTAQDITNFHQQPHYLWRGADGHDTTTTTTTTTTTADEALETLLEHGAVLVPQLLSLKSIANLRAYLQHKNAHLGDEEAYPMSQGYQRLSYGIEATEDPSVQQALGELASHPLLPALLTHILGVSDPALTELTAITAYYRAEDQVIHSDTKSDGYAGQFGRTYAHTYSLFLPVQDTTTDMGVTQICPGTHYCTNDDLDEICGKGRMVGVNDVFGSDNNNTDAAVWKAGDGFLFNQQVWHGGSRHSNPDHPERIMFIVSFIARPQLGIDHRQLARGYVMDV